MGQRLVFQPGAGLELEIKEENKMELLEQCQIWNENDEYQKIIDALEAVPAEERTPCLLYTSIKNLQPEPSGHFRRTQGAHSPAS